jgi:hypothetical protein
MMRRMSECLQDSHFSLLVVLAVKVVTQRLAVRCIAWLGELAWWLPGVEWRG